MLLSLGQHVVGLDNFTTGAQANLNETLEKVGRDVWGNFSLLNGDVTDLVSCRAACAGVDAVLHQAGFISVPASVDDPIFCNEVNVSGTLNLLVAARDAGVKNFVYASSAAVYGDDTTMPQREERIGRPMSPYGASKLMDEIYAGYFARQFGMCCVGLRYFNVFGPRQKPSGGYAAVVPLWISTLVAGGECIVNGDGSQTRDFCHVSNIVQANLLAATTENPAAAGSAYNVAIGGGTSLIGLHSMISARLTALDPSFQKKPLRHGPARPGDIIHSSADTTKIREELGFDPAMGVDAGLEDAVSWYVSRR
jgi:UDP-N-acetylglucosamine/UDP-N-acetylgalactosamine 4-epimerase